MTDFLFENAVKGLKHGQTSAIDIYDEIKRFPKRVPKLQQLVSVDLNIWHIIYYAPFSTRSDEARPAIPGSIGDKDLARAFYFPLLNLPPNYPTKITNTVSTIIFNRNNAIQLTGSSQKFNFAYLEQQMNHSIKNSGSYTEDAFQLCKSFDVEITQIDVNGIL